MSRIGSGPSESASFAKIGAGGAVRCPVTLAALRRSTLQLVAFRFHREAALGPPQVLRTVRVDMWAMVVHMPSCRRVLRGGTYT